MRNRITSILLIMCMVLTLLPTTAMAEEADTVETTPGSAIEEDTDRQTVSDVVYSSEGEEKMIEGYTVSTALPEIKVTVETAMLQGMSRLLPMMTGATVTNVPYIDASGDEQTTATATEVTASDTEWSSGWYAVAGDVTISNSVRIIGDVHLILENDCSLSVTAPDNYTAGINITGSNSLTIYAQSAGSEMGSLTATGGIRGGAGIGGNSSTTSGAAGEGCGTVTICGGIVTATGGSAGIGGGSGSSGGGGIGGVGGVGGMVTIYGGTVTAAGGNNGGAGIGGGDGGTGLNGGGIGGHGGTVTIYSGTVYATGGVRGGAGIGGGTGGNANNFYIEGAAGGNGSTVTVHGGTVFATGADKGGAGIGGGCGGAGANDYNINYTNDGNGGSGGSVTINGGTVIAIGGNGEGRIKRGANIGSGAKRSYSDGTSIMPQNDSGDDLYLTMVTLEGAGDGDAITALTMTNYTYGTKDMKTDAEGKLYIYLPSGTEVTSAETGAARYSGIITTNDEDTAGILTDKPIVRSVTPSGSSVSVATNTLTITFSEPMNIGAAGTVTIRSGAMATLAASPWSNGNTTVTYNLSGLEFGEMYTLTFSSFQDAAGNEMDADNTHNFTVSAAPATYPLTVELNGGIGGTASADYAAGASISIHAGTKANHTFNGWTSSGGGTFGDQSSATTTFTMPANSVTITANWSYNSGGTGDSDSGSGRRSGRDRSSADNSSLVIVTPPAPDKPDSPTQGEIKVDGTVDSKGNVTVRITNKTVTDAFDKALADAKKKGNEQNGITVVLRVDTGGKTGSNATVNLPKTVQDIIISKRIVNTIVVVDNPGIRIGMDLATVQEINKQANSDVNITAARTDSGKLTVEAKNAIGSRPVFELKVNYGSGKQVQGFGAGSVSVTIPYTLGANEKAGNVQAVYIDGYGKVYWLTNSAYDSVEQVLRFTTDHFSTYGIGYKQTNSAFTDIAGHWAKEDIEFVVSHGLFSGTSATTFSPNTAMTRGMFVTALGRLANADVSSYKQSSFTDVKSDAYFMGCIEWANKNSIVNGTGDGKFAPDQSITREQMAVIMQNYAKVIGFTLPKVHGENTFADSAKISAYAKDSVEQMQMAGILNGKNVNLFDPQGTASRAEVSAVLRRFVEPASSNDT